VDIDCDPGVGGSHWTSTRSRKKINHNQKSNEMKKHARGLSDNEWESDELVSNEGSDSSSGDEDTCGSFPTFCMPKSMAEYEWQVGTYFVNKEEFIEAIRTYGLQSGRNLKFEKNDKKRVRVVCLGARGKCVWIAYYAYVPILKTWQLRKIVDKHTCSREFNNRLINAKWLSGRIEKTVRENPTVKAMHIREKGLRKWNVSISRAMSFRARSMAINSQHSDMRLKVIRKST